MASYKVEWTRPRVYVDVAGQAVDGFQVRILMMPWNEARDLYLKDANKEAIDELAVAEVKKRAKVAELEEVEVEI